MVQRSVPLPQRSGLEACCLCLINQLLVQLGFMGTSKTGFRDASKEAIFPDTVEPGEMMRGG